MEVVMIPLVIISIVMLAIIKLMNNMLSFGTKKEVVKKEVECDKKKNFKIWKIIKVPIYIITTILFILICFNPTKIVIVGAICCVMLISFFESESKKTK